MMNKLSGCTFLLVTNICTFVIIRPQMKLFTGKKVAFRCIYSKVIQDAWGYLSVTCLEVHRAAL